MYTPQVNQLRSLDYRIKLLMDKGRYQEADQLIDQLLPLYDWLVQVGNDPIRTIGKDRKHYEVLKHQCGARHEQAEAGAQDWLKQMDSHLMQATTQVQTDLRSATGTYFRVQDMVNRKPVPPDVKKDLVAKLESLKNEIKRAAWALGEEARDMIFHDGPSACTKFEIAIEVMKKMGMKVKAQTLEEELGTAVYVQQTGSRLQDVQERLKKADKAEDIEKLEAEMERIRNDVQQNAAKAAQSASSAQAQQMQGFLSKILKEVEETKAAASQQKQVIIAENVRIGDDITIKDSVVQRSQIGGGGAGGPVVAGQAQSGSKINVQDSVVMRSELGGHQEVKTDVALKKQSAPPPKTFAACPYCGEKLNLPKTPKFCPYCAEQLVH